MAYITPNPESLTKGVPFELTLNKESLRLDASFIAAADAYFKDDTLNWKYVEMTMKSVNGKQTETVNFNCSDLNTDPTANFTISSTSRDAWEIDSVAVFDYDGDSVILTLANGQLNPADYDFDLTPFTESFESGGFVEGGWNTSQSLSVDSGTTGWFVGTNTTIAPTDGTFAAYVSDDGGATHSYTNSNKVPIIHIYKDIFIPTGFTNLSVDWYCVAEGIPYDYLHISYEEVSLMPDPVVDIEYSSGTQVKLYAQPTWITRNHDMTSFQGQTVRFIFSWKNDVSANTQPPAAIDNIKLT